MEDNKEIEKDNINVEENQNSVVSELKEAIKEQAIEEEKPQSSNFTLQKFWCRYRSRIQIRRIDEGCSEGYHET